MRTLNITFNHKKEQNKNILLLIKNIFCTCTCKNYELVHNLLLIMFYILNNLRKYLETGT